MNKHDKMVERNRLMNGEKEELAIMLINQMKKNKENVKDSILANRLGYSRSFFYQNPKVHAAVKEANLGKNDSRARLIEMESRLQISEYENKLLRERNKKMQPEHSEGANRTPTKEKEVILELRLTIANLENEIKGRDDHINHLKKTIEALTKNNEKQRGEIIRLQNLIMNQG